MMQAFDMRGKSTTVAGADLDVVLRQAGFEGFLDGYANSADCLVSDMSRYRKGTHSSRLRSPMLRRRRDSHPDGRCSLSRTSR